MCRLLTSEEFAVSFSSVNHECFVVYHLIYGVHEQNTRSESTTLARGRHLRNFKHVNTRYNKRYEYQLAKKTMLCHRLCPYCMYE